MDQINIILADDHSIVRDGIKALLEEEPNLHVIGEASNGKQAVDLVLEKSPDLLIIDIRMPEMNGIEALETLKNMANPTRAIILSMHDSEEYILNSIKAGAKGFLLKDTSKSEFIKAIHTVHSGGKYFSGEISDVLVNNLLGGKGISDEKEVLAKQIPFDLTNKEIEILKLVLSGLTNKEISEKLNKSQRTIETHRYNLMKKMDVKNLIDLSNKAHEFKLV